MLLKRDVGGDAVWTHHAPETALMWARIYAAAVFYPTLAWNFLLARVLHRRRWSDRIDDHVIVGAYPFARDVVRRADGSICSMGFWVDDPQGRSRPLMLHFDANGILERKEYGGPHVRPPERSENVGFGS